MGDNDDGIDPKLDEACAYFEHFALPLLYVRDVSGLTPSLLQRQNDRDKLVKADYGQTNIKTSLYIQITTPKAEYSSFGIGVGIYLWQLKVLSIICLIVGFLFLPNILYYQSNNYLGETFTTNLIRNLVENVML